MYDNKSYDSIPAYKLLRTAGLQHYTRGFIERGYGINLGKLSLLSDKDREKLYEDLKVLPGHTVKLDKIINTLSQYTLDKDSQLYTESGNVSEYSRAISQTGITHSKRGSTIRSGKADSISKKSIKDDADLEYEKQLERVFNEYTPLVEDKKKSTHNSKMSQKVSIGNIPVSM